MSSGKEAAAKRRKNAKVRAENFRRAMAYQGPTVRFAGGVKGKTIRQYAGLTIKKGVDDTLRRRILSARKQLAQAAAKEGRDLTKPATFLKRQGPRRPAGGTSTGPSAPGEGENRERERREQARREAAVARAVADQLLVGSQSRMLRGAGLSAVKPAKLVLGWPSYQPTPRRRQTPPDGESTQGPSPRRTPRKQTKAPARPTKRKQTKAPVRPTKRSAPPTPRRR